MLGVSTAPGAPAPGETSPCISEEGPSSIDAPGRSRQSGRHDPGLDGKGSCSHGCSLGRVRETRRRNRDRARDDADDRPASSRCVLLGSASGDRPGRATDCIDMEGCLVRGLRKRREGEAHAPRWLGCRPESDEDASMDGAARRDELAQGINLSWMRVASSDTHVDGMA